jgi:hypothetical protein
MRSFVLPAAVVFVLLSGPSSAQMGRGVDRHTQDAQCVSRYNGSPSGRNCQMPTGHLCSTEGLLSTGACFHDGIWEPLADLQPLDLSEEDEEAEESSEESDSSNESTGVGGEGGALSAETTEGSETTNESDTPADSAEGGETSAAGSGE